MLVFGGVFFTRLLNFCPTHPPVNWEFWKASWSQKLLRTPGKHTENKELEDRKRHKQRVVCVFCCSIFLGGLGEVVSKYHVCSFSNTLGFQTPNVRRYLNPTNIAKTPQEAFGRLGIVNNLKPADVHHEQKNLWVHESHIFEHGQFQDRPLTHPIGFSGLCFFFWANFIVTAKVTPKGWLI